MALQKSKVQLAPPTKKIYGIEDGRANSEIGYFTKIIFKSYKTAIHGNKNKITVQFIILNIKKY